MGDVRMPTDGDEGYQGTVAVVGGGYMGGGIAQSFAATGIDCVLIDATPGQAQAAVQRLHQEARRLASKGLVSDDWRDAILEHLTPATSLKAGVADASYVSEAVPEQPKLKNEVLREVSAAVRPEVAIGTNTSAIPIHELARGVTRPERFLGVHWMNPAPFVPCVEIIPSDSTDPAVVEDVHAMMRRIGKAPTVVSDSPGFVANRLQYALFREAVRLVEEGVAGPAQIDEVVRNSFGFRLPFFGPFAIADIAGLDVYREGFTTMEAAYGERIGTPALLDHLVAQGRHGLKTGAGFYRFDADQGAEVAAHRDAAYAALNHLRAELGDVTLVEDQAQ
jgi:3-hydroxybutyryl-CoA dehydrogenase